MSEYDEEYTDEDGEELAVIDLTNNPELVAFIVNKTTKNILPDPSGNVFPEANLVELSVAEIDQTPEVAAGQVWRDDRYTYKIISTEASDMLNGCFPAVRHERISGLTEFSALAMTHIVSGKATLVPPKPNIQESVRWISNSSGTLSLNGGPNDVRVLISANAPADMTDVVGYLVRQY